MKSSELSWKPQIIPAIEGDVVEATFDQPGMRAIDRIESQLDELARVRNPASKLEPEALREARDRILCGTPLAELGAWVVYPWLSSAVHVLPPELFREVRCDRNRYKILPAEAALLRTKTLGIIGLSVGHVIATTLALEGVGGRFKLADFDAIELSNLNRIPCGLASEGVNKAVVAARKLFEIDPYLQIEVFEAGLTDDNAAAFFEGGSPLDLLIEECDDLYTKVKARELARDHGVPVLMETNDRGMLDVERYDLEPERPVLHGLIGHTRADALKGLTTSQKVPFVLPIIGAETMSDRMAATLVEIDETVTGWTQLGSGTVLGGAVVTETARRILLGEFRASGRYFVDLTTLVSPDSGVDPSRSEITRSDGFDAVTIPGAPVSAEPELSSETIRYLVGKAARAPSGGNLQPWRFVWKAPTLFATVESPLARTFLDYEARATSLALGAALENLHIAALDLGLEARLTRKRGAYGAYSIELGRSDRGADPLVKAIDRRVTNRRLAPPVPIPKEDIESLMATAEAGGIEMQWIDDSGRLSVLADLLGRMDRFRFLCRRLYEELLEEIRWNDDQTVRTRDGIDIETLELPALDRAGLELLRRRDVMEMVRRISGGSALQDAARKAIEASTGLALFKGRAGYGNGIVSGGRVVQRVWLRATELDISVQPWSISPYVVTRYLAEGERSFSREELQILRPLADAYISIFGSPLETSHLLLVRLGRAPAPTRRSLRLPVDRILRME